MIWQSVLEEVAAKLDLSPEVVKEAYGSYWKFVRESITALPFKKDLTEEDFSSLRTNFNIPSIGKLSCTFDRYKAIKDRYKYVKKIREMGDFKTRMVNEYRELGERLEKLSTALNTQGFKEKVGEYQYNLMCRQVKAMTEYWVVLEERLKDLGVEYDNNNQEC